MGQRAERRSYREADIWTPWRWPVAIPATVHEHGSCGFDVQVVDLSLTGCRIWAGFRLNRGRAARIVVPDFAPFRGRIAWSADWYAAIAFDQTIHASVLTHLVGRYPARTGDDAVRTTGGTRTAASLPR